MKFFAIAAAFACVFNAQAELGVVNESGVCGFGNVLVDVETSVIAAEYWSGAAFAPGETIFGSFSPFGLAYLRNKNGKTGQYFIYEWQDTAKEARDDLCK